MREPPARVRFVGHPVIAMPVYALCALAVYAWSQEMALWPVGMAAILAIGWTLKASQTRGRYRAWRRAWDSLAAPTTPRSAMPRVVRTLAAVVAVGGVAAYHAGYLPIGSISSSSLLSVAAVIGMTMVGVALWRVVRRWARRSKTTPKAAIVTVCVNRPVMPVPTMADAYTALPEHCWKVLGR